MAAAVPVPVPVPVPEGGGEGAPMGDLFQNYDATGALGGMFAPAYIKGFDQSEQAVQAWQDKNRGMTWGEIEQTRMPNAWLDPKKGMVGGGQGYDVYGAGRIPTNLQFGDSRGMVDPQALLVAAQGGKYDFDARRSAIAQRLQDNASAQALANQPKKNPWAWGGGGDAIVPAAYNPWEYQND